MFARAWALSVMQPRPGPVRSVSGWRWSSTFENQVLHKEENPVRRRWSVASVLGAAGRKVGREHQRLKIDWARQLAALSGLSADTVRRTQQAAATKFKCL